jgi:simple sugar transport system permease protein
VEGDSVTQISSDKEEVFPLQGVMSEAGRRAALEEELGRASRKAQAVSLLREASLLPGLIVLIIVGAILNPDFLKANNWWGITQTASALGVTTAGEALVMIIWSMDLSLGGIYGFAPMLAAWLVVPAADFGAGTNFNSYVGILVLLLAGAAVGLVNAFLIVKARLNAFVITLGMIILLAGCQLGIDDGNTISALPRALWYLGFSFWGPVPVSLVVTVVILLGIGLFLRYHPVGRAIYAVGGNAQAARAAGINVDRVKMGVFVAAGVLAAIGGLMEMGRVQAITAAQGYSEGVIFMVFAAAAIGGVSLSGGRGNMVGVATGTLLITVVQNILDLENVNSYWVEAADGLLIELALIVGRESQTGKET